MHQDQNVSRIETERGHDGGFSHEIVRVFRKRMQAIRAARDERDFYKQRSLRFEKLKGKMQGKYSMRLNDQWRLIFEIDKTKAGVAGRLETVITIVGIKDYH